jgi:hypothetical protein
MNSTGVGASASNPKKTKARRRKYIINPAFQWKYALTLGLAVFLVASIVNCAVFASLHEQARDRFIHPTSYSSNAGMLILMSAFGFSVLTAGAVGFWMVITTHRICGPLFVLDKYFRYLAAGRLPGLRPLRRKDEFKDLFKSFTRAVDRIRADQQAELGAVTKALASARSDRYMDEQACRQALDTIARQLENLRRTMADSLGEEPAERPSPNPKDGSRPAAPLPAKPAPVGAAV